MRSYTHLNVSEGERLRVRIKDTFLPLHAQGPEVLDALVEETRQLGAYEGPIELDLSYSGLGAVSPEWIEAWVDVLPPTLRAVDFTGNDFGGREGLFPCYWICVHGDLEEIYLGGNELGKVSPKSALYPLLAALKGQSDSLRILELGGNAMSHTIDTDGVLFLGFLQDLIKLSSKLEYVGFAGDLCLPYSWDEGLSYTCSERCRGEGKAVALALREDGVRRLPEVPKESASHSPLGLEGSEPAPTGDFSP